MQKNNLQDIFLTKVRKQSLPVTVFLMNGFQMRGSVTGFDSFTVVLDTDGRQQVIYKHAISTIVPLHPVALYDPWPAVGGAIAPGRKAVKRFCPGQNLGARADSLRPCGIKSRGPQMPPCGIWATGSR